MMRVISTKLQSKSLRCRETAIYLRYLQLQGLCVPSVKTTTYVCNRFNTSLCAREHKTNQAISNLNRKF